MFFGDSVFRYPTGRLHDLARTWSRRRSWGSCPSQCCSCPRTSGRFRPSRPLAVFRIAHPDNLVGGPVARIPRTHLQTATGRGRFAAAPGFFSAGNPFPACSSRRAGRYCPGLWPLSGLRTPVRSGVRGLWLVSFARSANHGGRFRSPDARGVLGGVEFACGGHSAAHLPGRNGRVMRPPPVLQRSWLAPSRSRLSRSSRDQLPV